MVDDGNGPINGTLVGQWKVKTAYFNNNLVSGETLSLSLIMREDGSGDIQNMGITLPYEQTHFTWNLSTENVLTITLANDSVLTYNVTRLTATEAVIKGDVIPTTNMRGEVRLDLVRVGNPGGGGDEPGDTAAFPGNTTWRNQYSTTIMYGENEINVDITSTLKFNLLGDGGSISFLTNASGFPITYSLNFTYTFNSDNNTGVMTVHVENAEDTEVPFTYDPTANTITFSSEGIVLPAEYAAYITLPETLVFARV